MGASLACDACMVSATAAAAAAAAAGLSVYTACACRRARVPPTTRKGGGQGGETRGRTSAVGDQKYGDCGGDHRPRESDWPATATCVGRRDDALRSSLHSRRVPQLAACSALPLLPTPLPPLHPITALAMPAI